MSQGEVCQTSLRLAWIMNSNVSVKQADDRLLRYSAKLQRLMEIKDDRRDWKQALSWFGQS